MQALICHIKEHIQPFERKLALQELDALTSGPLIPVNGDYETASTFSIEPTSNIVGLREALAYWHSIGNDSEGLTAQLRGEATQRIARGNAQNGISPENISSLVPSNLPSRRSLRYATHGLHEYKGKFFPQLVRALMNIAQLPENAVVLDPMCGSGTTLVEARLSGRSSYGIDMNPLSVFITDVKCQALALEPATLSDAYRKLDEAVRTPLSRRRDSGRFASLANRDQAYLERWFSQQTIMELDHIEEGINKVPIATTIKKFYRIALSNVLRRVSWQKDEDLRIRREEKDVAPGEVILFFLKEAARSTRTVAAFLAERGHSKLGTYKVWEADARQASNLLPQLVGTVDAVITSPPYATALPYIDTDRLSLIYLGLLPREQHSARDALMIGNREISRGVRTAHWASYEKNRMLLPESTRALIEQIDRLNKEGSAGFRRKNLSALLAKYFFDMLQAMQQMFTLLRPGGSMFLVVGNNRTTAGRKGIEISTPDHLAMMANSIGFHLVEDTPMEMLVSRSIFKKNAIDSERILRFEKI